MTFWIHKAKQTKLDWDIAVAIVVVINKSLLTTLSRDNNIEMKSLRVLG